MKRYVFEPTIKKLEKLLPYSIAVPHGFKTHAQAICRKNLGLPYYSWAPVWAYMSNRQHAKTYWKTNNDAVWQYRDGRLYFKDEGNCGMLTLAMLSKPKNG